MSPVTRRKHTLEQGESSTEEDAVFRSIGSFVIARRKHTLEQVESSKEKEDVAPQSIVIALGRTIDGASVLTYTDVHGGLFHKVIEDDCHGSIIGVDGYTLIYAYPNIYFIGGYRFPNTILNQVSVFNVESSSWGDAPSMNQPRVSPVLLNYENKIYSFGSTGSAIAHTNLLSPHTFSEYYDLDSGIWSYLPDCPPKELLSLEAHIVSHAFNQTKGMVFFWVDPIGVYSYNFKSRTWAPFEIPNDPLTLNPDLGLRWSISAVSLGSFIIWHFFGTIYAYDFHSQNAKVKSLFTLPNAFKKFGNPREWRHLPSPSYLVSVGNNKICLVYGNQHNHDSKAIRCRTFSIQFSPDDVFDLALVYEGCKSYHCEDFDVASVVTMDCYKKIPIQFKKKKHIPKAKNPMEGMSLKEHNRYLVEKGKKLIKWMAE